MRFRFSTSVGITATVFNEPTVSRSFYYAFYSPFVPLHDHSPFATFLPLIIFTSCSHTHIPPLIFNSHLLYPAPLICLSCYLFPLLSPLSSLAFFLPTALWPLSRLGLLRGKGGRCLWQSCNFHTPTLYRFLETQPPTAIRTRPSCNRDSLLLPLPWLKPFFFYFFLFFFSSYSPLPLYFLCTFLSQNHSSYFHLPSPTDHLIPSVSRLSNLQAAPPNYAQITFGNILHSSQILTIPFHHSLTHSFSHSLTPSLTQPVIPSLTQSLNPSLSHSHTHSVTHSLNP